MSVPGQPAPLARAPERANDPIFREIVKGSFAALVREMALLIERTSMSPIIREKQDYAIGLFDPAGRMILAHMLMQGPGMIDAILERFPLASMRAGDIYAYNDPYLSRGASGHVPDITFCLPIYEAGRIRAFIALFGHFWDIGGLSPGGMSALNTEIFHEGIRIPPVRIFREGVLQDDVYRILMLNTRFPEYLDGDFQAAINGCRLGAKRVEELFGRYGADSVMRACEFIIEQSAETGRRRLEDLLPPGRFSGQDTLDGDGLDERPYSVRVEVRRDSSGIVFDFGGTDAQARGSINFILHPGILKSVLLGRFLAAYEPDLVLNDGLAAIIDRVDVPPGSLLNPQFPASVALRALSRNLVMNAVLNALGQVPGAQVPAASCNYGIVTLRARDSRTGAFMYCFEGFGVGMGARPWADGIDSVYLIGQKNNPAEWLESEYPLRVEQYGVACDSAGPGKYRGGVGIVRDIRLLEAETTLGTMMVNARQPSFGANGGMAGSLGRIILNPGCADERELPPLADGIKLKRGDLIRIISAGGGGWGDPRERSKEAVLKDVARGYVSPAKAAEDYGVKT